MRGHAAKWPPGVADRNHLFRRRTRFEIEGDARGFLYGEIASRPGIGVAKTEQQIDIGRPWADAMQSDQCLMRCVGFALRDVIEVEIAFGNFGRDRLDRFDLFAADKPRRPSLSARARRRASG